MGRLTAYSRPIRSYLGPTSRCLGHQHAPAAWQRRRGEHPHRRRASPPSSPPFLLDWRIKQVPCELERLWRRSNPTVRLKQGWVDQPPPQGSPFWEISSAPAGEWLGRGHGARGAKETLPNGVFIAGRNDWIHSRWCIAKNMRQKCVFCDRFYPNFPLFVPSAGL